MEKTYDPSVFHVVLPFMLTLVTLLLLQVLVAMSYPCAGRRFAASSQAAHRSAACRADVAFTYPFPKRWRRHCWRRENTSIAWLKK